MSLQWNMSEMATEGHRNRADHIHKGESIHSGHCAVVRKLEKCSRPKECEDGSLVMMVGHMPAESVENVHYYAWSARARQGTWRRSRHAERGGTDLKPQAGHPQTNQPALCS